MPTNISAFGHDNWFLNYLDKGVVANYRQVNYLKYLEMKHKKNRRAAYHILNDFILPTVEAYNVVPEKIYYRYKKDQLYLQCVP